MKTAILTIELNGKVLNTQTYKYKSVLALNKRINSITTNLNELFTKMHKQVVTFNLTK